MGSKDPLLEAIKRWKRDKPESLKNEKLITKSIAALEKSLKSKDKSYAKRLAPLLKALAVEKKQMEGDKAEQKLLTNFEKIVKEDSKKRMKIKKMKIKR